jgi:hypothetical protein
MAIMKQKEFQMRDTHGELSYEAVFHLLQQTFHKD